MGANDVGEQLESARNYAIELEQKLATITAERDACAAVLLTLRQVLETLAGTERIEGLAAVFEAMQTHQTLVDAGEAQINALAAEAFTDGAKKARRNGIMRQSTQNPYDGTWIG